MEKDKIQDFADENKLDVMLINTNQWRLLDIYGERVLDVYFKYNKKKTRIVKNSTCRWRDEKWFYPETVEDLEKLLDNKK